MLDVEQAKRFFPASSHDLAARKEFKVVAGRIKRAINRDAAFSGEMIFLLRGQRSADHPWIQQLLEVG